MTKSIYSIFFLCCFTGLLCNKVYAQFFFKALTGKNVAVAGKPFQLQYVVENKGKAIQMTEPAFAGLRKISGPHIYNGTTHTNNKTIAVKNYVYTVLAPLPGIYTIPSIICNNGGNRMPCDPLTIEVVNDKQPSYNNPDGRSTANNNIAKTLENGIKIIVTTDKKVAYTGEAITVVYTLLSSIESKTTIKNNPAFLGFSVQDMVHTPSEDFKKVTIGGREYEAYILRSTRLYPLQTGTLWIDAMEVQNKARLLLDGKEEYAENTISSEPVAIKVKSLPKQANEDTFTTLVGHFFVSCHLGKPTIHKNDIVPFTITLTGDGDTKTFLPPRIQWPLGIEVSDPIVKDSISFINNNDEHTHGTINNMRMVTYNLFVSDTSHYTIPAIEVSYFSTDSNLFKTIKTKTITFTCNAGKTASKTSMSYFKNNTSQPWIYGFSLFIVLFLLITTILYRKKKKTKTTAIQEPHSTTIINTTLPKTLDIKYMLALDDQQFSFQYRKHIMELAEQNGLSFNSFIEKHPLLQKMVESCVQTGYAHMPLSYTKEDMLNELEVFFK